MSFSRICIYCGVRPLPNDFYRKCEVCFRARQQGLRQTGRTCAALKELAPDGLYVVPYTQMASNMRSQYREYATRIMSIAEAEYFLEGRAIRPSQLIYDHSIYEGYADKIGRVERLYKTMPLYKKIQ